MRGGLWSSFSEPSAGILTSVEPYCEEGQVVSGELKVGTTAPQKSPPESAGPQ